MLLLQENGTTIQTFYNDQFKSDEDLKEALHKRCQSPNVKVVCDCQEPHSRLSVVKNASGTIYLRNYQKDGDKHLKRCRLHSSYASSGPTEAGWKERDTDDNTVNPHFNILMVKEYSAQQKDPKPSKDFGKLGQPATYSQSGAKAAKNRVTLFGVGIKVIMLTQERLARRGIVPANIDDFRRYCHYTLSLIHPNLRNPDESLQDHIKTKQEMDDMKGSDRALIIMPLIVIKVERKESKRYPHEEYEHITLVVDANYDKEKIKRPIEYKITCSKELLDRAINQHTNVRINGGNPSKKPNGFKTMVFGYVRFNRRGKFYGWEFTDLAFIPIDENGLWVESEYERHVFNSLTAQNVPFYKPHESLEYYHDLTPDLMIHNPQQKGEWVLGEIFGRTEPDYVERKEKKIARMKELDHIGKWHWDATESTRSIPDIVFGDISISIPDFERKRRKKR